FCVPTILLGRTKSNSKASIRMTERMLFPTEKSRFFQSRGKYAQIQEITIGNEVILVSWL
ncbi:hypothetical protein, partial [Bacillus sp. FJAT-47783]|uniref:hypothetical protein n=1 Tax=Bacillus sp. FJAT-47783 TaxID=2922712 RepID=UPI001FAC6DC7